ncbi:MAG: FGGY family carbohydrate kinase, partial [Clostridia bacterium]|nr:FGGY family carbohydrate kinase [Clostridia bacterium]
EERISLEEMRPTGVYLKPALGLCNLYALIRERGGKPAEGARLYTLGSYLIEKLTGRNVCHITNAAPIGLADVFQGGWHRPLIEKIGFSGIDFPEMATKMEVCGYYETNGQRIAVYPDVGDVQASVCGSGAGAGDVVVNMGTAGQVVMLHAAAGIGRGDPRYYEIRPYFDGLYCHTISRMPSGRNLDVLVELVRQIGESVFGQKVSLAEVWQRLGSCGQSADSHGLSVDTSFYETPEHLADGAIEHIHRANFTLENLFSAAYADIGRVYAGYIHMMEEAVGQKAKRLVFCGGAVRANPLIRSAIEEAAGLRGVLSVSGDEVHEGLMKIACEIESAKAEKGDRL